jgi:predicted metal-dependent hydrolase
MLIDNNDKKIILKDIGEIIVKRNLSAKYIRLKIDSDNRVVLIVPGFVPEKTAINFAYEKSEWISKSLKRKNALKNQLTIFNEDSGFKTRFHNLSIQKHARSTVKSLVSNSIINIWYPDFASVEDPRIQTVVRRAIEEAWRIEAKVYLPKRVNELASQHGFHFKKVSVKKATTRWGSCSSENNISLNIQLMRLPGELTDYVILHELVHTIEKNHQSPFWSLLEKVMPGAKKLDKQLNNYNLKFW